MKQFNPSLSWRVALRFAACFILVGCAAAPPSGNTVLDLNGRTIGEAKWQAVQPYGLELSITKPTEIILAEINVGLSARRQERIVFAKGGYILFENVRPEIYSPAMLTPMFYQILREDGLMLADSPLLDAEIGRWSARYATSSVDGVSCFGFIIFDGQVSKLNSPGNRSIRGGSCSRATDPNALKALWFDLIGHMNIDGKSTALTVVPPNGPATTMGGSGRQLQIQPDAISPKSR